MDDWNENEAVHPLKCVLVGDAAVGKTCLIVSYTTNGFPSHYTATAFDNYSVVVRVDKKPIQLQLHDTAGQASFDSLRPLCYEDADVFVVVYSVAEPSSFHSVLQHWLPEITRRSPGTPIILVGTQVDLRWKAMRETVSTAKGKGLASHISAVDFFECSALTQYNLKQMFDAAILAGLESKRLPAKTHKNGKSKEIKHGFFQRFIDITKKLI